MASGCRPYRPANGLRTRRSPRDDLATTNLAMTFPDPQLIPRNHLGEHASGPESFVNARCSEPPRTS